MGGTEKLDVQSLRGWGFNSMFPRLHRGLFKFNPYGVLKKRKGKEYFKGVLMPSQAELGKEEENPYQRGFEGNETNILRVC